MHSAATISFLMLVTLSVADLTPDDESHSLKRSSPHSAQINLPGFGEVDLDRFAFKLPTLTAPSFPSLSLPNVSLPKLFSEVPCVSPVSLRAGTCKQKDVCAAGSGLPDGPCALGLGVCCTMPFTCGQTIIGNLSVISNPGYPEPSSKSDLCTITIMKSALVSQIRLDFEAFDIAGADEAGRCSEDVMEIVGANPGVVIPRICGMNQGQHLYIHVEKTLPLSPVLIKFIFSQTSTTRLFRIRVTQLGKDHPDLAPAGCLQYFMGQTGVVRSFNYEHIKDVGIRTIKGLTYGVCFRKESGFCSVRLDPKFTRHSRSLPYGYFPAQHPVYYRPAGPVYHRPAGSVYHRPGSVYLMRAPHQPFSRPVYYRPAAPVYYENKKLEDKKDVIAEKKDELDGLLAKKKMLIESLFSGLSKVPALPAKPAVAPVYYPENNNGYYKPEEKKEKVIPKVDIIAEKKEELDGLLAKKQMLESLFPGLGKLPALPDLSLKLPDFSASLPDLTVKLPDLSPKLPLLAAKLPEKSVAPAYPDNKNMYYKPEDKKEIIAEKKDELEELLAKKKALIDQALGLGKIQGLPVKSVAPSYYPDNKNVYYKPEDKKVIIAEKKDELEELLAKKKMLIEQALGLGKLPVLPGLIPSTPVDSDSSAICGGKDSVGVPPAAFICVDNARPVVLTTEPFAIFIDTRGEELSRGFSFIYTHQICT